MRIRITVRDRQTQSTITRPSPFRGRWLWTTLAMAVLFTGLLGLGFWQLARLGQRRAANAYVLGRLQEPPLQVDEQMLDPDAADLRRATVRGTYDFAQEIVLRNRTLNELPGVHVIVPLRIAGSDAAILVDRGWIPYESAAADQRTAFDRPAGEVVVTGILRRSQVHRSPLSPPDPPLGPERPRLDAWFRVDIPRIREQTPYPLLPVFLEEEAPAGQLARRFPWPDPDVALSEGSHLGNAIQWFAFASILLAGYVLLYRQRAGKIEYKQDANGAI
ncbi:MAG: SURF1 family protein [Chloroflexi bacterium]|nr:SURF1 family protein [Chloroflexota bacterium]